MKQHLETLNDGVIAIIITIMVLRSVTFRGDGEETGSRKDGEETDC